MRQTTTLIAILFLVLVASLAGATYTWNQTDVDTASRVENGLLLDVADGDSLILTGDIWLERSGLIIPDIDNFWLLSDAEGPYEVLVDTITHKDGRPAIANNGFATVHATDSEWAASWDRSSADSCFREEGHYRMIDEWDGKGTDAGPSSCWNMADGEETFAISIHAPCTTQVIKTNELVTFPANHHWAISAKIYNRDRGGVTYYEATGGTDSTLIDTDLIDFPSDEFNGGYVYMRDGANAGLQRDVVDFDSTTGIVDVSPKFPNDIEAGDGYHIIAGGYKMRFTIGILNASGDTIGQALREYAGDVRGFQPIWYHFQTGGGDESYRIFIKTTGLSNIHVADRFFVDDVQVTTFHYFGLCHNADTLQGHSQYSHYMSQECKWFYSTPFHTTDYHGGNIHVEGINVRQGNGIGGGKSFRFRNYHQSFQSYGVTIRDCHFTAKGQAIYNLYFMNARSCNVINNILDLEADGWFPREQLSTANIMATGDGMDGGGGTYIDSNILLNSPQFAIAARTNQYLDRIKIRWNFIQHKGREITNAYAIWSGGGIGIDTYGNHIKSDTGQFCGRGIMLEGIADHATPCLIEYDTIEVWQIGNRSQEYTKTPMIYGLQWDAITCGITTTGMILKTYGRYEFSGDGEYRQAGARAVRISTDAGACHKLRFIDCEFYGLAHSTDWTSAVTFYGVNDSSDLIFRNCKIVSNDTWVLSFSNSRHIPFINCEFVLDSTFTDSAEIDRGGTGPVAAFLQKTEYWSDVDSLFFIDCRFPDSTTRSYLYDSYFRGAWYNIKYYDEAAEGTELSWFYGWTTTIVVSDSGGREPEEGAEVVCMSTDSDTIFIDTTDVSGTLTPWLWEFFENPIDASYNKSEDRTEFNDYTIIAWNEAGTLTDTVVVTIDQKRTVNLYFGEVGTDRGALRRRSSLPTGSGLINKD